MAGKAVPIWPIRTLNNSQPAVLRVLEKASNTFLEGVPVFKEVATGLLIVWSGVVATSKCLGISCEPAANLTTAGTPKTLTFGSVPNQSSGKNIPRGAPLNDAKIGVYLGEPSTIFCGRLLDTNTLTQVMLGTALCGLTADSNGYWYVDTTKTDSITIVGSLDPVGTLGARMLFKFATAAYQLNV